MIPLRKVHLGLESRLNGLESSPGGSYLKRGSRDKLSVCPGILRRSFAFGGAMRIGKIVREVIYVNMTQGSVRMRIFVVI